jgi:hypothetical protein
VTPSDNRSARTFTVDSIETTIAYPEGEVTAATSPDGIRFVVLPGLTEPLQFFRVPVAAEASDEPPPTLLVVNALHAPLAGERTEGVRAILAATQRNAIPCFVDAYRAGWTRARAVSGANREVTAAAVAVVQYGASWDESDPIVVDVNGTEFAVSVSFRDGKLRARVTWID